MKELPLRLCESCHKEYQPKRVWQRFCSIPCKNNNYTSTHQLIQTTERELPKHYTLSPTTIQEIAKACADLIARRQAEATQQHFEAAQSALTNRKI